MIELRTTTRQFAATFYKRMTGQKLVSKSQYHFSLVDSIHCLGVACYDIGAHAGVTNIAKSYLLPVPEVGMLQALAAQRPEHKQRLLTESPELFIRATGVKLIVAFSDEEYEGWHYTGKSHSNPRFVSPDGQLYDQRNIMHYAKKHGISYTQERDRLLKAGWRQQTAPPRMRWVYLPVSADEFLLQMVKGREPV